MYGHMLLGLASFVENTCAGGSEVWIKICHKAGVNPEEGFFTHEVYSDDIFFKLAEAAISFLGLPMEHMLEQFGEYTFSVYWRKSKHDSLLDALGYTMDELISNLDALHLHLSSTYPEMIAPSFSCEPLPQGLKVHYHSCRPGLVHYVKGVLQSVAENIYRLNVDVVVEKCEMKNGVMLKNHCQLTVKLKGDINENTLTCLVLGSIEGAIPKVKIMQVTRRSVESILSSLQSCDHGRELNQCLRGNPLGKINKKMKGRKTMSSISPNFHVASIIRKRGGSITSPNESSVDSDTQWPITPELFSQVSPFHVLFDHTLSILSLGESLAQLLPGEPVQGEKLDDYFSLEVPNVMLLYKNIRIHSAGLFIINLKRAVLTNLHHIRKLPRLRGQMIPLSSASESPILFLGSPAVNSFQELESMGLSSAQLTLSDPLHELLKNNAYFATKVNLSDELERAKHHLQIEQTKLQREKDRIDHLLQAMLPVQVAAELKANGYATPQEFSQISVLFTGLENFDAICKLRNPLEVVILLNRLFKCFDSLVEKHNVYKVETTGDSYMMAAGLPGTAMEHAQSVTDMAFDMRDIIDEKDVTTGTGIHADLELVIGIHSGPVVAGVIGTKLPRYCLFGDTVNTASRMNSTGEVGKIHISHNTYENLKGVQKYHFVSRGRIFVKGLGLRATYFVETHEATPSQQPISESYVERNLPAVEVEQKHHRSGNYSATGDQQSKSTNVVANSWTVSGFTSHISPSVCDRMPIATS